MSDPLDELLAIYGGVERGRPRQDYSFPQGNGEVPPAAAAEQPKSRRLAATDLGNAELLAELQGDRLRYVKERRAWLLWQDGRWRRDLTGEAERAAKETARELLRRAAELEGDGQKKAVAHAMASQGDHRLRAMLNQASTEPGIALAADELDRDPWLLTCRNATVDLRTGQLRPHDPADLISLGTDISYDPDAKCERWERFLLEIFDGDEELVAYIKRALGYSLTGVTREHVLFVCYGIGRNGKGTLLETFRRAIGDFGSAAEIETFMRTRGDRGVRNDLARLHRARFVTASEPNEGRRLDEAAVKRLTGGDTVLGRFLYAEHFEFVPRFKIWLNVNHRPRADGDDEALWARVKLIPFTVSFLGREDRHLDVKLEAERPGILAWAVQGCLEWQRDGLGAAEAVETATAEYRQDEDVLGSFIAERCQLVGSVATKDLREAYEAYCDALGEKPLGASELGKRLTRRGIGRDKTAGERFYKGISLLP